MINRRVPEKMRLIYVDQKADLLDKKKSGGSTYMPPLFLISNSIIIMSSDY